MAVRRRNTASAICACVFSPDDWSNISDKYGRGTIRRGTNNFYGEDSSEAIARAPYRRKIPRRRGRNRAQGYVQADSFSRNPACLQWEPAVGLLKVLRKENSLTLSGALVLSLISSATLLVAGSHPLLLKPHLSQPGAELTADLNDLPGNPAGTGSSVRLVSQSLPVAGGDAVRTAEVQQGIALARARQHELEMRARQQEQQRQFALKFNQLVDAVASFAKAYNQGKGTVWPQREAEKLRKAMRQIQQLEKSLRDDLKGAPAPPEVEAEITQDGILHK